jgi:hypothetical protein
VRDNRTLQPSANDIVNPCFQVEAVLEVDGSVLTKQLLRLAISIAFKSNVLARNGNLQTGGSTQVIAQGVCREQEYKISTSLQCFASPFASRVNVGSWERGTG